MSSEVFSIICTDGTLNFPGNYLVPIFQVVADLKEETGANTMTVPFTRIQVEPLLDFTASLEISLGTKEEWQQLFAAVDYFQLKPRYEKFLIKSFMKWQGTPQQIQNALFSTSSKIRLQLKDCRLKLEDPSYQTQEEIYKTMEDEVGALFRTLGMKMQEKSDRFGDLMKIPDSKVIKVITEFKDGTFASDPSIIPFMQEAIKELDSL